MSLLTGGPLRTPSLAYLDERARDIFRRVVEGYLETGEPVGSRTLSRGGIALSPASIRNTMQDLAQLGLLDSPHTSAGRLPTHAGLRLFVDGLLQVGDVAEEERRAIEARLHSRGGSVEDAIAYAERWFLLDRERAAKSVQFMMDPTWRAYISCYVEGLPLCRRFVDGDPARFERLLTEQLLPADLLAA